MNSRLVGFYQANGFLFTPGLHLPQVKVADWKCQLTFKVVNVRPGGEQEGHYVRRGVGTDCRSVLLQQEDMF